MLILHFSTIFKRKKVYPITSIIIPTYNRFQYLGETLDSVRKQSYSHWECIVVDDGSKDATEELMEFYCQLDSRITFHKRPENSLKGANSCRNYGFELSKGKFIQYLDSDDLISERKIEEQVKLLSGRDDALATTKWGVFADCDRELFEDLESYRNFNNPLDFLKAVYKSHGYFPPHAYLINRSIIEKVGGWNEQLRINQDGEFMTRLICNTKSFYYSKNSFVLYRASRKDSTSIITKENVNDHYHCMKLIESYLMIRFKEEIPEFKIIKWKAFQRIPQELSKIYKEDSSFFYYQIKEKRNNTQVVKELKKKIKYLLKIKS